VKTYLLAIAIKFSPSLSSAQQRYEKLEKIRALLQDTPLIVHEDNRPVAIALFGKNGLIFHMGLDQSPQDLQPWQKNSSSVYPAMVSNFLEQLKIWPDLQAISFLIAHGDDPMEGLQVTLDRESLPLDKLMPQCLNSWQPQTIYTYGKAD
jgi:3,4-dihydroxy 2-butanone 4-phosphate synthase/GTP cyclohydrolase II